MKAKSIVVSFKSSEPSCFEHWFERVTTDVKSLYPAPDGLPPEFDVKSPFADGMWFTSGCDIFERLYGCGRALAEDPPSDFIKKAYDMLNSVENAGESAGMTFKIGEREIEIRVYGSSDYPDLTDEAKLAIGRDAYKAWFYARADELDKPFCYPEPPPVVSNADAMRDKPLGEALSAYADSGFSGSFEEWLEAAANPEDV